MQPTVGEIFEGKVTGITKFGAFVSLPDGKNGLVHISEIANAYVNDVNDHLSEGQTVKVKVIGINEAGKINLSIKKAQPPDASPEGPRFSNARPSPQRSTNSPPRNTGFTAKPSSVPVEASFEDKLKQFMQDSDSRMAGSRIYSDKKGSYKRRRD